MTVLAQLVTKEENIQNYSTYVFELLEKEEIDRLNTKYIMCTRFPNWDHRILEVNEKGYLNFREVIAGQDKWFDGLKMIPYYYSGIHFIKFVEKKENVDKTYIM